MIKLVGINKIYRTNEIETVALEDVNLTVNKGEFLSIMGPSIHFIEHYGAIGYTNRWKYRSSRNKN